MNKNTSTSSTQSILWLLGFYFVLWTVLPFWLSGSYALDVVEGIYWGREWQWGYYKHPPLSSWVLYGFYRAFGHIGPYLLSQLCIALSLWLVYRLGRALLSVQRAFLGALLLMGVFYYTWPSLEFNHNIAQLPLWAGIIYVLYLVTTRARLRYWLLFGVLAGLGMLVKYSVAILLVAALLYSLATKQRRLWLGVGPWLALLVAVVIFAPNMVWLVHHDWLPFTYAQTRAAEAENSSGRGAALGFLLTQLINHLPLLLVLLCTRTRLARTALSDHIVFLLWLGLGPALMMVLLGLLFGIGLRDMWGVPMWSLSGLLVAALIPQAVFERQYPRLRKAMLVWLTLATVLMVVYVSYGASLRGKPSRIHWPQVALAQAVDDGWQQYSVCTLDNVAGDYWLAGLAAAYAQDGPSVMIAGNPAYSPWMDGRRVAQHGSMVLWQYGQPEPDLPLLAQAMQSNQLVTQQGLWQLAWNKMPKHAPLQVQWRLYLPQHCVKPQP